MQQLQPRWTIAGIRSTRPPTQCHSSPWERLLGRFRALPNAQEQDANNYTITTPESFHNDMSDHRTIELKSGINALSSSFLKSGLLRS